MTLMESGDQPLNPVKQARQPLPTKPRRFLRIVRYLSIAFVILLAVLYVFRIPLFGSTIIDAIKSAMSDSLGGKYEIEEVDGNFFSNFRVHGLKTVEAGDQITKLGFEELEISISLYALATKGIQNAVVGIRIHDLDVAVEVKESKKVVEEDTTDTPFSPASIFEFLPESIPNVDIRGQVALRGVPDMSGVYKVEVKGAGENLNIALDGSDLDGQPSHAIKLGLTKESSEMLTVALQGRILGVDLLPSTGSFNIKEELQAKLTLGVDSGRMQVVLSPTAVALDIVDLKVNKLPSVAEKHLRQQLESLPTNGTIKGHVDWQFTQESGVGEFTVSGLCWNELVDANLTIMATGVGKKFTLKEIQLIERTNQLHFADIELDLESPYYLSSVGKGNVDLRSLDRFLSILPPSVDQSKIPKNLSLIGNIRSVSSRALVFDNLKLSNDDVSFLFNGKVEVPDLPENWQASAIDLRFEANAKNLSRLFGPCPVESATWPQSVKVTGTASKKQGDAIDQALGNFTVDSSGAAFEDVILRKLSVGGQFLGSTLTIEEVAASTRASDFNAQGQLTWDENAVQSWSAKMQLQCRDLSEFKSVDPALSTLTGQLMIESNAESQDSLNIEAVRGSLTIGGKNIVYDGTTIKELELNVARTQAGPVKIEAKKVVTPDGHASFLAALDYVAGRADMRVSQMQLDSNQVKLRLDSPFQMTWKPDQGAFFEPIAISGFGGNLRLQGSWTEPGILDVQAELKQIDANQLHPSVSGRIESGTLIVRGDPKDLDWKLTAHAPKLRVQDRAVSLTVDANRGDGGIRINQLALKTEYGDVVAAGHLPITVGVEGLLWHAPWTTNFDASITSNNPQPLVAFGVPKEFLHEKLAVTFKKGTEGISLSGSMSDGAWEFPSKTLINIGAMKLEGTLRNEQFHLELSGENVVALKADVDLSRSTPKLNGSFFLDETLATKFDWRSLSGTTSLHVSSLRPFGELSEAVLKLDGKIAANLEWSSLQQAADFKGDLRLDELAIHIDGVPRIDLETSKLSLRGSVLSIDAFDALLGYSPLALGGSIQWTDGGIESDLTVKGENCLLVRDQYTRVRSDLDLAIKGPLEALQIKGAAKVTNATYTKPVRFLDQSLSVPVRPTQVFTIRNSLLSHAIFDLKMVADDSIIIANNVASGRVSADLHLGGTGEYPEPSGRIYTKNMNVILPFSKLNVSSGEANFDATTVLNPNLKVTAATRMRGYDLSLQLRGPATSPTISVSSNPPLPSDDALVLLMTGATPAQISDQGIANATITRTGQLIGASILESISDPADPDKEGIADRFTLEIGRDVSPSGTSTIETEVRLSKHFFLRLERDRYEEYNIGGIWRVTFK